VALQPTLDFSRVVCIFLSLRKRSGRIEFCLLALVVAILIFCLVGDLVDPYFCLVGDDLIDHSKRSEVILIFGSQAKN